MTKQRVNVNVHTCQLSYHKKKPTNYRFPMYRHLIDDLYIIHLGDI